MFWRKVIFLLVTFTSVVGNGFSNTLELDLSGQKNLNLEKIIEDYPNVVSLLLGDTDIDSLPPSIAQLKYLRVIDISDNPKIPVIRTFELLAQVSTLKVLKVDRCNLLFLPSVIDQFRGLEELSIAGNSLFNLPRSFRSMKIKTLNLSNNLIDSLSIGLSTLKELREVDFSYNEGCLSNYNLDMLASLPRLKRLRISGIKSFPREFEKLNRLEELNISNSTVDKIGGQFSKLISLRKLNMKGCANLGFDKVIESLGSHSKVEEITVGHPAFNIIPYNLTKLKKLESLNIENSNLARFSSGFGKLKSLQQLSFFESSFEDITASIHSIAQLENLKTLIVEDCGLNKFSNLNFGVLNQLSVLDIRNNGLPYLPIRSGTAVDWNSVNIKGNKIGDEQIEDFLRKNPEIDVIRNQSRYSKVTVSDKLGTSRYQWISTSKKPFTKIIYPEVGELLELASGTRINIPGNAFLKRNGELVKEMVEIRITELIDPLDIALHDFKNYVEVDENRLALSISKAIKIQGFQNGEEVFVNNIHPIVVQFKNKLTQSEQFYYFNKESEKFQLSHLQRSNKRENEESSLESNKFEKIVKSSELQYPKMDYQLKTSKVYLRIKKYTKKKRFYYSLEPQYGFNESVFYWKGNKIKGYPELKTYKNIKWNYVGEDFEGDLNKLYFLSQQADEKKIKKRSSFYVYVLDLNEVTVYPHKTKDNYVMEFSRGFDTLKIDVLPNLSVLKPSRIQKWHKRKYKKYLKARKKREEKWNELESQYLMDYKEFENQLEEYRNQLNNRYLKLRRANNTQITNRYNNEKMTVDYSGWWISAEVYSGKDIEESQCFMLARGGKGIKSRVWSLIDLDENVVLKGTGNNIQFSDSENQILLVRSSDGKLWVADFNNRKKKSGSILVTGVMINWEDLKYDQIRDQILNEIEN